MYGLFQSCAELNYLDLSNFDTSSVYNMKQMFNGCKLLKKIKGINLFKTNKVTSMNEMFQLCTELESLDLSNFNTANVSNMENMFYECNKLKYLNLLNFKKIAKIKEYYHFKIKIINHKYKNALLNILFT